MRIANSSQFFRVNIGRRALVNPRRRITDYRKSGRWPGAGRGGVGNCVSEILKCEQPAIAAMCEKRLIEFLRDFLAKQPGVQVVPQVTVVYK